jgi:hypothetical protein
VYILLVLPYYRNTININTVININLKLTLGLKAETPTPLSKNPWRKKNFLNYEEVVINIPL